MGGVQRWKEGWKRVWVPCLVALLYAWVLLIGVCTIAYLHVYLVDSTKLITNHIWMKFKSNNEDKCGHHSATE